MSVRAGGVGGTGRLFRGCRLGRERAVGPYGPPRPAWREPEAQSPRRTTPARKASCRSAAPSVPWRRPPPERPRKSIFRSAYYFSRAWSPLPYNDYASDSVSPGKEDASCEPALEYPERHAFIMRDARGDYRHHILHTAGRRASARAPTTHHLDSRGRRRHQQYPPAHGQRSHRASARRKS